MSISEEFPDAELEQIISEASKHTCWSYAFTLGDASFEALSSGDLEAGSRYRLLARILTPRFKLDNPQLPFEPMAELDKLTDQEISYLKQLFPKISNDEIRARIADVLWVKTRYFEGAKNAFHAYLLSALRLESNESSLLSAERAERAIQIAIQISNARYKRGATNYIEHLITRFRNSGHTGVLPRLMVLLQRQNVPAYWKYALLCQKLAEIAEDQGDWSTAHAYWVCKAQWHTRRNDRAGEHAAKYAAAETHVKRADSELTQTSSNYMLAAHYLKCAILELRELGDMRNRVSDLSIRLIQCERNIPDQMAVFTTEGSLEREPYNTKAREAVRGLSFDESFRRLAHLIAPPDMKHLANSAKSVANSSPLLHFMSRTAIDGDGRTVGRMPSALSDNEKEVQKALESGMFEIAKYRRFELAVLILTPAVEEINNEHTPRIDDFLPMLVRSVFVPLRREIIFAKGLYAGLNGDYVTALHLLIPQIENSIRYILRLKGVIVSGINPEGIEDWYNLGTLLNLPATSEFFGPDLVFDMRGLLSERHGQNRRNALAHGYMNEHDFGHVDGIYIWWLTIHLCYLVVRKKNARTIGKPRHEGRTRRLGKRKT